MRPRDVARGARKMTRTVKGALVLASTTLACVVLIGVVHDQQVKERDALHQGVIRDKELWRRKVRERGRARRARRPDHQDCGRRSS